MTVPTTTGTKPYQLLRNCAALLLLLSGLAHIASLWFRELTMETLGGALLGTLYLFIALGLFGQSRFTLFIAILIPGLACWLQLTGDAPGNMTDLQLSGLVINTCVIGSSAYILWRVRHHSSV